MYQGNWTCSQCSGAITELPFQPRSERGLTCRDCFMKNKQGGANHHTATAPPDEFAGGAEAPAIPDDADLATEAPPPADFAGATATTPGEKPRFSGNWECAECGGAITALPFQPRDTSNLKCLDCFKRSKA